MSKLSYISVVLALLLMPHLAKSQSEETSLGELARTLRKNQAPPRTIIDNDNLPAVMEQGENKRWESVNAKMQAKRESAPVMHPSSPDVTCALSFSGQRDLLEESFRTQNLPETERNKLNGPATIAGESLQVAVHNGSNWDLREITVGLTVVQRQRELMTEIDGFKLIPAALAEPVTTQKTSDLTVLYHLKGTAAPSSTTLFQAPLNVSIRPDQEWHWAIIQAKGIAPAKSVNAEDPPMIQAPN